MFNSEELAIEIYDSMPWNGMDFVIFKNEEGYIDFTVRQNTSRGETSFEDAVILTVSLDPAYWGDFKDMYSEAYCFEYLKELLEEVPALHNRTRETS